MKFTERSTYIFLVLFCIFTTGYLAPAELRSNHVGYEYDYDESWEYNPEEYLYENLYKDQLDPKMGSDEGIINFFTCVENGYYIASELLCDGFNDCPEGSDEAQQICGSALNPGESTTTTVATKTEAVSTGDEFDYDDCTVDQFSCSSLPGMCISTTSLCDGVSDCPGGEDEEQDNCEGVPTPDAEQSFDINHHPEVNILHPEIEMINPEFDVLTPTSAGKQASESKLKFATSGNGRTTQEARKSKERTTSPYKLLFKIFERSPLKKKLKVLNRLQRLALRSGEIIDGDSYTQRTS